MIMKKLTFLLTGLALLFALSSYAQQPFEKYGYKAKVVTLSQGKYEEFFDQDTLVQIGSVIMNRLNGKILAFVEYDTMYSEATLEPEVISRWLSPDPLADERYNVSPYNFVQNNPINRVDPTGLLDVFALDQESGGISLVQETDDATDKLVDGQTGETISAEVDKGLLSDGQNIMENGLETANVKGGIGLVKDISMHTKDEVGGTVYENGDGDTYLSVSSYEHSTITRNENGEVTNVQGGFSLPGKKGSFTSSDGSFTGSTKYSFHTHPGHPDGIGNIGTAIPSGQDIGGALQSGIPQVIFGARSATYQGQTGNTSITTVPSVRGTNGKILPGLAPKTIMRNSKR
ncbi:MAG: RHS repeat-associated core domain-containing protein [Reichenbachiella sp.]|uniref:RHS repeat-associated core domain-containing protein n=1 Tax=Reichenbachiella sp. TaxID=2184521 RepID=UPI0032655E61